MFSATFEIAVVLAMERLASAVAVGDGWRAAPETA
jgi:hypothetical protein